MSEREHQVGHHCPSCGYDLTGLVSDRCPECGWDIAFIRSGEGERVIRRATDGYSRSNVVWWCVCGGWIFIHAITFHEYAFISVFAPSMAILSALTFGSLAALVSRYEWLRAAYRCVYARAALWTMLPWLCASPIYGACWIGLSLSPSMRQPTASVAARQEVLAETSTLAVSMFLAVSATALVMFLVSYRRLFKASSIWRWEPRRACVISVLYASQLIHARGSALVR